MALDGLPQGELTQLLKGWSDGDPAALERLTPIVYAELYRIARFNLRRERDGHVLQPTALLNEAFVRLMAGAPVEWASRTHFFAVFARVMRQILIDFARGMQRGKRGDRAPHVDLAFAVDQTQSEANPADLLDVDAALHDLARWNPRQAQLVELRFFGGLANAEIGAVLGISEPSVRRDWRLARAWLYSRLQPRTQTSLARGAA